LEIGFAYIVNITSGWHRPWQARRVGLSRMSGAFPNAKTTCDRAQNAPATELFAASIVCRWLRRCGCRTGLPGGLTRNSDYTRVNLLRQEGRRRSPLLIGPVLKRTIAHCHLRRDDRLPDDIDMTCSINDGSDDFHMCRQGRLRKVAALRVNSFDRGSGREGTLLPHQAMMPAVLLTTRPQCGFG
jgi:hypothetical protein